MVFALESKGFCLLTPLHVGCRQVSSARTSKSEPACGHVHWWGKERMYLESCGARTGCVVLCVGGGALGGRQWWKWQSKNISIPVGSGRPRCCHAPHCPSSPYSWASCKLSLGFLRESSLRHRQEIWWPQESSCLNEVRQSDAVHRSEHDLKAKDFLLQKRTPIPLLHWLTLGPGIGLVYCLHIS